MNWICHPRGLMPLALLLGCGLLALPLRALDRQTEAMLAEREAQMEKSVKTQQAEMERIDKETLAALQKLLAERTAAGDLNGVMAVKQAIENLKKFPAGLGAAAATALPAMDAAKFANRELAIRRKLIAQYAPSSGEDAAKAVQRGLRALQLMQNEDGSWGKDPDRAGHRPALTGFAVLAFLGFGESSSSLEFGKNVTAGVAWLKDELIKGKGVFPGHFGYTHPIGLAALAEAAAMNRDSELVDLVAQGTRVIIQGQNGLGGFNYGYKKDEMAADGRPRTDLSVGGWNYQAMAAATYCGAGGPELQKCMERSANCILTNLKGKNGNFKYCADNDPNGGSLAVSSAGAYSLLLLGKGENEYVLTSLDMLSERMDKCDWNLHEGWLLYRWYYHTNAQFHGRDLRRGPTRWKKWQREVTRELLTNQEADGGWSPPDSKWPQPGAETQGVGLIDSRTYASALCCLILETWFRYPPLSENKADDKPFAVSNPAAGKETSGRNQAKD